MQDNDSIGSVMFRSGSVVPSEASNMSTRNLQHFIAPRSVALIGASDRPASVGATVLANLIEAAFQGPIWPVNPGHVELAGRQCYPDVESLPEAPDLAVIVTPAATVPELIDRLGRRGTRAAVVISAGFAESGTTAGRALHQAMLDAARPYLLRIIGPNTLGLLVPTAGLNASFAPFCPEPGNIAFLSQSGALLTSMMDWAHAKGVGFSRLVALGSMSDVDFGDLLGELAEDPSTDAILLYVEAVTQPRKFLAAAQAAARNKPVIVCKAGRHPAGVRAVASHTGAMAGTDAVYDCAFRRAGMVRVQTLAELFDAAAILALVTAPAGDRLAIVTNGGGVGILATDELMDAGGSLAELSPATLGALDAVLPTMWSRANPVDLVGDASPARYADALGHVLEAPEVDAVLVLHVPVSVAEPDEVAAAVIAVRDQHPDKPLLTSWIGGDGVSAGRQRLAAARLPTFATPEAAVRALAHLLRSSMLRLGLRDMPPAPLQSGSADHEAAGQVIAKALSAAAGWLDSDASRALLRAYGVPVLSGCDCDSPAAAGRAAAELGGAVALKVRSPDLPHKTEVGGVVLDLVGETAVREAAVAMLARIRQQQPHARLQGFLVEPLYRRLDSFELIVGAAVDVQFGPVILFGQGGTATELLNDRALALPPLNRALARDLVERTRVSRLLAGFRGQPGVDLDKVADVLVQVAQLMVDQPAVQELDINPLVADPDGVLALDVRVRVAPSDQPAHARLSLLS